MPLIEGWQGSRWREAGSTHQKDSGSGEMECGAATRIGICALGHSSRPIEQDDLVVRPLQM